MTMNKNGMKGFIGSRSNQTAPQKTTTHQGGNAYTLDLEEKLCSVFTLGLIQGNFFQGQEEVIKATREVFEKALKDMPYIATQYAVYAAEELGMKLAPTIWLVYVSTLEDKTLFKVAFDRIINNPKMLHDFMEIARKAGIRKGFKGDKNGMGQAVKKTVNRWLYQFLNEYNSTRYTNKLEDVVRLTRPEDKVVNRVNTRSGETEQVDVGAFLQYIFKPKDEPRRLTFDRARDLQIVIDNLNSGVINDETRSLIRAHRLQLEELKHTFGNLSADQKKEVFVYFVPGLRYNALVSNLVAIERAFATSTRKVNKIDPSSGRAYPTTEVVSTNIPKELVDIVAKKLESFEDYKASKMLPFGLLTANEMTITQAWKNALNKTLARSGEIAFADIPTGVRVMASADTSGSMGTPVTNSLSAVDIASYFCAMVAMSVPNSQAYATASSTQQARLVNGANLTENAIRIKQINVGMGTYFESLLNHYSGENYVVLITDGQDAGNMERKWASLTNRPANAKLIIWHVAGHAYFNKISTRSDVLYLKGYSDTLLKTLQNIMTGKAGQPNVVRSLKL